MALSFGALEEWFQGKFRNERPSESGAADLVLVIRLSLHLALSAAVRTAFS